MLREVLKEFEASSGAVSLTALSRKLNISEGLLSSMLDYWVRQGALKDNRNFSQVATTGCAVGCTGCSLKQACGFKARAYTLASGLYTGEEK